VNSRAKPVKRCAWASREPLITYHDEEWGSPAHDDRTLFEFLVLEGAQAGLSWDTILNKRAGYRAAFERFDPKKVAKYTARDEARLLKDAGIVRNRAKISSAVTNAKAFLEVQREFGSFDAYVWKFTDPKLLSKDLLKRGFRFVGPTIMEAFMEAVGILDHHEATCFRRGRGRSAARRRRE
jgi:DNA-3-methyladenine glycosylase I